MVYVDEMRKVPESAPICFRKYGSCHMTADTLNELHHMAEIIGMRREWFQSGRIPHYDLTRSRRKMAIANGAVFKSGLQQARERIRKKDESDID